MGNFFETNYFTIKMTMPMMTEKTADLILDKNFWLTQKNDEFVTAL